MLLTTTRGLAFLAIAALTLPMTVREARSTPHASMDPPALVLAAYHHRHHGHRATQAAPPAVVSRPTGGGEYGGVDQFGFPDNDPERPNGANNTVTAQPGTDAYEEQENNRRYFCNFAPSRC